MPLYRQGLCARFFGTSFFFLLVHPLFKKTTAGKIKGKKKKKGWRGNGYIL
jgi:hypothetical protein